MKNRTEWIICFGSKLSSPSVYTEKQIVKRLHRDGYKILWVNPIPQMNMAIRGGGNKNSILKKILNRIKSQLVIFSKVQDNFYQMTPFFFPDVEGKVKLNSKLLKYQLMFFSKLLKINKFSIISSGLTDIPYLYPQKSFNHFIQISGDIYSDLRGISKERKEIVEETEIRVFNFANYILAASKNVHIKVTNIIENKNKALYFPHGVEFEHFNNAKKHKLPNIKPPIAGYFGSLTDNNDQRMFMALAEAGFSVILIGKVVGDYSSCNHKNIHFLGAIDYQELPNYANNFDLCIMAWKPAEWICNSNPSKTLEYFAMGKPIVSNTIPELKNHFSDLMYFADEPEEFVNQATKALSENNDYLVSQRKMVAKNENWEKKYDIFKKLLEL